MYINKLAAYGLLFIVSLFSNKSIMAQHTKIAAQQQAPLFSTQDVSGNKIALEQFRGKKVLVTFHRNVGCPICNLRFHELEKMAATTPGLVLLAVYESTAENMRKYLDRQQVRAVMIPDTAQALYKLYGVERSKGKIMKGMLHGAMGKMKAGNKLFTQKIKQDGNMDRIGADFLVNEEGKILIAHYDRYVGDHLPVEDIVRAVK
jgi:thioredoxin-dependent peroxiredoxin